MKKILLGVALGIVTSAAMALAPGAPASTSPDGAIVIRHVTLIDVAGGAARPDMSVIIKGKRIVQVAATAQSEPPKGATIIEGAGKFLIPGLWDMHVHIFFGSKIPGGKEAILPLFIANGVTGVRDMGSDLEPILAARRDTANGKLPGPRIVLAGPMLDGPKSHYSAAIPISTPADGRRAVTMLKRRGVDFIKVQSDVPRDAFFAIADECRRQNIRFAGHVPDSIRAGEAIAAGQHSFEHLIGIFEASSTAEDEMLTSPKGPGKFLATYEPAREAAIIDLLVKNQTWQVPTLFWERGQWLVDAIDVSRDPDAKYAPRSWREKGWPRSTAAIIKSMLQDPLPLREKFVAHELDIVNKLYQAGVPLLAGTDTAAGVDLIPGVSLHLELERFVAAGLTPLAALQTATVNAARFLGREQDFGSIDSGKLADLVLLDANPLDDIRNTRRIDSVIGNGHYYPRSEIDKILASVEAYARTH